MLSKSNSAQPSHPQPLPASFRISPPHAVGDGQPAALLLLGRQPRVRPVGKGARCGKARLQNPEKGEVSYVAPLCFVKCENPFPATWGWAGAGGIIGYRVVED